MKKDSRNQEEISEAEKISHISKIKTDFLTIIRLLGQIEANLDSKNLIRRDYYIYVGGSIIQSIDKILAKIKADSKRIGEKDLSTDKESKNHEDQ